jgi:hypothetical protein
LVIVWDENGNGSIALWPAIIRATDGILGLTIVLAVGVLVMLQRHPSELISGPTRIGGVTSLFSQSGVTKLFQPIRSYDKQAVITSTLKDVRFSLA